MVKQNKVDFVNEIKNTLDENRNFILTKYSGIKVSELTSLRAQIREKGASFKVVKNNLFKRALDDKGYTSIEEHLKGPIGVAFAGDQIGDVAQVLKKFKKDQKLFDFFLGVIDGAVYDSTSITKIADLPSKEVLISQIMSLINGPATGIAVGSKEIMSSLARAINATAEKNNA
ncbi:MAG: 50S ribosomal protein L10 [Spirochaetes bacterium]|jgi:large subunit ribosomal protein L10|nr:50S ribosomal protein L10 [Spirochaetota bacterium]